MTVRKHITKYLTVLQESPMNVFRTSDLQELAYIGKNEYGKFLGSTETYTREFRRMRTDGVLKVEKIYRKNRQQVWELHEIQTNFPNDVV